MHTGKVQWANPDGHGTIITEEKEYTPPEKKEEPINILTDYTVTDKAEGEGKLLYVLGHNHLQLEKHPNKKEIAHKVLTLMRMVQKYLYLTKVLKQLLALVEF